MTAMPLTRIEAENFTVFEKIAIPFCKGLNVLVGENGMGKTHIMKMAYAACQASKRDISFSHKTVMLFRPEQAGIGRLVNRNQKGVNTAKICIVSLYKEGDAVLCETAKEFELLEHNAIMVCLYRVQNLFRHTAGSEGRFPYMVRKQIRIRGKWQK